MNVGDLMRDLSHGELRNLAVSHEGSGSIDGADHDRMVYFANRALTRIYSRFVARRQTVILPQQADRFVYPIRPAYALSAGGTGAFVLIDTQEDPFKGDLIRILSVRVLESDDDYKIGENLRLNEGADRAAVKTLSFDTLQFMRPRSGRLVGIELQLNHPRLEQPANLAQPLLIPPILEEALAIKIAQGVYASMNGADNLTKANVLEAEFERLAVLITDQDLLQTSMVDESSRLSEKGWI